MSSLPAGADVTGADGRRRRLSFPRVSCGGRISGVLSVPESRGLVTLRYLSPRAAFALGEIGGASGEGKPEAKVKSQHLHPQLRL